MAWFLLFLPQLHCCNKMQIQSKHSTSCSNRLKVYNLTSPLNDGELTQWHLFQIAVTNAWPLFACSTSGWWRHSLESSSWSLHPLVQSQIATCYNHWDGTTMHARLFNFFLPGKFLLSLVCGSLERSCRAPSITRRSQFCQYSSYIQQDITRQSRQVSKLNDSPPWDLRMGLRQRYPR